MRFARATIQAVRVTGRILIVLAIALGCGFVVLGATYVGATLASGRAIYSCQANQPVKAAIPVPLRPNQIAPFGAEPTICGLTGFAPVPWWVKAATGCAVLSGGIEAILTGRRRRTGRHRRIAFGSQLVGTSGFSSRDLNDRGGRPAWRVGLA
jgi:hypothetical protein